MPLPQMPSQTVPVECMSVVEERRASLTEAGSRSSDVSVSIDERERTSL